MTLVKRIEVLETCFDGALSLELEMDTAVDESLMRCLAKDSKLDFYPSFPKPYFRICVKDAHIIQGVIGNYTFRVTCEDRGHEETIGALQRRIEEASRNGNETQEIL